MENISIFNVNPYTGTNEPIVEPSTISTKGQKTTIKDKAPEVTKDTTQAKDDKTTKQYFNIFDDPDLKNRWYKVFYSIFRCIGIKKPNLDKETFVKVARSLNRWLYTSLEEDLSSYKDSPVWCCNNLAITLYMIAQIDLETYPAIKYHSTINRCEELVTDHALVELFLSMAKDYKAGVKAVKENQK